MATNRRPVLLAILTIAILTLALSGSLHSGPQPPRIFAPAANGFSFAAAGDITANANTDASFQRLVAFRASFFLALGDLSYGKLSPEAAWCDYVKSKVGDSYPFELLSGNHEDGGEEQGQGLIDLFANCLPDHIGPDHTGSFNGIYGKEYYFDYPAINPLTRVILISPGLIFTMGGSYSYDVGTPHYNWVAGAIDGARSEGIPWVIVGMHKVCISAGIFPCGIGTDLMDLLINKRVDLVLQAHDHDYQRSKQLTCAKDESFTPSCVVDDGSSGAFAKGAGTLFVIDGTFGRPLFPIDSSDLDNPYFSQLMGVNTPGNGNGFVEYTVSPDRIDAKTSFSGSFADAFSIIRGVSRTSTSGPNAGLPIILLAGTVTLALLILLKVRRRRPASPKPLLPPKPRNESVQTITDAFG